MRTINFTHNDNEKLDTRNDAEIAKRVARIMEQYPAEGVVSVEADGEEIIEYHENENDSIEWSVGNINYNEDGTIKSVQIHC